MSESQKDGFFRLKLEIPKSQEKFHVAHKTLWEEHGFTILKSLPVYSEEPGCLSFIEHNYELNGKSPEEILDTIKEFFKDLKLKRIPTDCMGMINLHSLNWFKQDIVGAHMDEALGAIFFGNMQGGTFLDHWEISFDKIRGKVRQDKILVDFEYDRQDIILVRFENEVAEQVRGGPDGAFKVKKGLRKYFITVSRNSIRRMIVDPLVSGDTYRANRYRIHFELNTPPLIREAFIVGHRATNGTDRAPRQRVTTIKRGTEQFQSHDGLLIDQKPKDAAISDSPFFTLEFSHNTDDAHMYDIISRLRARCGMPVEFANIPMIECHISQNRNPYFIWICSAGYPETIIPPNIIRKKLDSNGRDLRFAPPTFPSPLDEREAAFQMFLDRHFKRENIAESEQREKRRKRYIIRYLIECLISRGAIVKDQLWLNHNQWETFLQRISMGIGRDFDSCETALERLVNLIDERKRVGSLHRAFDEILNQVVKERMVLQLTEEEVRAGYQRVRKLIFTPTRIIYVVPEMLMSNRVLREMDPDGTSVMRISFRDDDGGRMTANKTGEKLIERTVKKYLLTDGVTVAGRCYGYLGSSNSQMRDCGAYMMIRAKKDHIRQYFSEHPNDLMVPNSFNANIRQCRKELGKFELIESVPKMMARLGQCFTQSRASKVELKVYSTKMDIIGGADSKGGDFTFSDGVGTCSVEYIKAIAKDHGIKTTGYPSCIQIRYRGYKGVLSVDPTIDEFCKHAIKYKFPPSKPFREKKGVSGSWEIQCLFRKSQDKFHATNQSYIEVVKISTPVPVAFNKPFLNIMDQVSEMQSRACHQRITNRIEELLDNQLRSYANMMIHEKNCRMKLKEFPGRIDIDILSELAGFTLSSEPFFRSLIKASVKYSITKQLRKQQINIPTHLGRSMLGVVDETGLLQEGQIFAQYTVNIGNKHPSATAVKKVLKGTILMTKNPCIVEGDVRIFEAVDISELRHLVDVVIFPQHGPRPHPDQMAGSDLDGDEYTVIWDPQLLLMYNMDPFDFAAEKRVDEGVTADNMDAKMVEFYTDYLTQDSVGTISNNFLFQSDLYGINAKVCHDLALKNSQAVDFTKSGKPPDPLTTKWRIEEDGEEVPPEKAERTPDFHVTQNAQPIYESSRLMGRLFREIRGIEEVIRLSEDLDEQMDIEIDAYLHIEGWEDYKSVADEQLSRYNSLLRTVMENYGIRTEAEIISGCISEMRNRISDRDQDDMSFYNTNHMLETRITELFKEFRITFFQEFPGGWVDSTTKMEKTFADENNICHRICLEPSQKMMQKAVAYYRACYSRAQETREKKLSFAWIAYDILARIRTDKVINDPDFQFGINPLHKMIQQHNVQYINENQLAADDFFTIPVRIFGDASEVIKKYCIMYGGIERVLFIICEWASKANLFTPNVSPRHLCLVFIMHATNLLATADGQPNTFINWISPSTLISDLQQNECPSILKPEVLIKFFEFLASRKFKKLNAISFIRLGYQSIWRRGEWLPFYQCAQKTYHNLVFNLRFEELPLSTDRDLRSDLVVREAEPFAIELPVSVDVNKQHEIVRKMKEKTGVESVLLRPQLGFLMLKHDDPKGRMKFSVIVRGTLESIDRLRRLVAVRARSHTIAQAKEMSELMAKLTYEQIMA